MSTSSAGTTILSKKRLGGCKKYLMGPERGGWGRVEERSAGQATGGRVTGPYGGKEHDECKCASFNRRRWGPEHEGLGVYIPASGLSRKFLVPRRSRPAGSTRTKSARAPTPAAQAWVGRCSRAPSIRPFWAFGAPAACCLAAWTLSCLHALLQLLRRCVVPRYRPQLPSPSPETALAHAAMP
jgi:hypothetical protein